MGSALPLRTVLLGAALVLGGCVTTVPAQGSARGDGIGEAAIYTTVDGKARLFRVEKFNIADPYYPTRARRLEWEDDVEVRCVAPGDCTVLQAHRPELAEAALRVAAEVGSRRRHPYDVTMSFRVLSLGETFVQWAPSPCPKPKDRSWENHELERQFELKGNCLGPPESMPDAAD